MRKAIIALALTSSVLAAPGYARDGSAYVGFNGGVTLDKGADLEIGNTNTSMHAKTNTGWDADVIIGYDLGKFRLEGEGAYKQANIQQLTGNNGIDVDTVSPGVQAVASVDEGGFQIKSLMANVLYDAGSDDGLGIYAGAGLGYAWTEMDAKILGVVPLVVDDEANGIAWQILAGLRLPVTRHLEIGAKYRYFNVEGVDYRTPTGGSLSTSLRSHSILASLIFNFGGAPEPAPAAAFVPPPTPPAPLPPPPPQTRTCPDGTAVAISQACPVPPPPPVPPVGERG